DRLAMFLKLFGGETMATYEASNEFLRRTRVRQVGHGRSFRFPIFGQTTGAYHTPGTAVTPAKINQAEREIGVDALFTSSVFVDNLDEAMAHYEARQVYTQELGNALSRHTDVNVAYTILKAARSASVLTGTNPA